MGMLAPAPVRRTTIHVALVDEHRLVLDGLSARLGRESPRITVVAADASWAAFISRSGLDVDVVVLDQHLDDTVPLVTKLQAIRSAGAAALVMSRHCDSASVNAAMRAGAMGFVPKSDSAEHLIAAITAVAAGTPYLSERARSTLATFTATPDAGLGSREHRALVLFAGGRSVREVAGIMSTTEETVKSYIKRARQKYRQVGIELGTRALLRRHGIREGWIAPE